MQNGILQHQISVYTCEFLAIVAFFTLTVIGARCVRHKYKI